MIYTLLALSNPFGSTCHPAREPPSNVRGVGGSFYRGQGGKPPLWVWAKPKVFRTLQRASAVAERASQSPHFAPQSIVGYTLHGSGAESRGEVWWSN